MEESSDSSVSLEEEKQKLSFDSVDEIMRKKNKQNIEKAKTLSHDLSSRRFGDTGDDNLKSKTDLFICGAIEDQKKKNKKGLENKFRNIQEKSQHSKSMFESFKGFFK